MPETSYLTPVHIHELSGNCKRWYAQALADRLYWNAWVMPKPTHPAESMPAGFRVTAAPTPKPVVLVARAHGIPRAFVPTAEITLGRVVYDQALSSMSEALWLAWWDYLRPEFNAKGEKVSKSALFRLNGNYVSENRDNSFEAARAAALHVLDYAWCEVSE